MTTQAFPIPSHLPHKAGIQDVTTEVLTKLSETKSDDLTAHLAASWVAELEKSIRQTKVRASLYARRHELIDILRTEFASASTPNGLHSRGSSTCPDQCRTGS